MKIIGIRPSSFAGEDKSQIFPPLSTPFYIFFDFIFSLFLT